MRSLQGACCTPTAGQQQEAAVEGTAADTHVDCAEGGCRSYTAVQLRQRCRVGGVQDLQAAAGFRISA